MRLFAALAVAAPVWAQGVSVGVRAGIPVTPMLTADSPRQASTTRFTAGPLLEVHLWRGLAAGADFLFLPSQLANPAAGARTAQVWRWEAPVTFLYRFHAPAQPFLRAGLAFNRVFSVDGADVCGHGPFGETFYCLNGVPLAELRHRGTEGFVGGAGLRLSAGKLRFDPEVRWTHWRDRNFGVQDAPVRSNLNEVVLLLGVVF